MFINFLLPSFVDGDKEAQWSMQESIEFAFRICSKWFSLSTFSAVIQFNISPRLLIDCLRVKIKSWDFGLKANLQRTWRRRRRWRRTRSDGVQEREKKTKSVNCVMRMKWSDQDYFRISIITVISRRRNLSVRTTTRRCKCTLQICLAMPYVTEGAKPKGLDAPNQVHS